MSFKLSSSIEKKLIQYIDDAKKDESLEYEMLFNQYIDRVNFTRVILFLRNQQVNQEYNKYLQVIVPSDKERNASYRVYISNPDDLENYYITNTIDIKSKDYKIDKKYNQIYESILIDDYDLKINLKQETTDISDKEISYIHSYINNINTKKKFRYIERYSFTHDDYNHRFDLSILKQNTHDVLESKKLRSSNIINQGELFHIELELNNIEKQQAATLLGEQLMLAGNILEILNNTQELMNHSDKTQLIQHYLKLLNIDITMDNLTPKQFGSSQPHTLKKENIVDKVGNLNILKGYSVTEKADGEKTILISDANGQLYIMNKSFNVNKINASTTLNNSILEGEYVQLHIDSKVKIIYLVYEIFVYKGKEIFKIPLLNPEEKKNQSLKSLIGLSKDNTHTSRVNYMKYFIENIKNNSDIDFRVKEFTYGNNIFAKSKEILDFIHTKYEYNTDGLIYTPIDALETYNDDIKPIFKWKPEDENTIDLLVKFKGYDASIGKNKFSLHCGYNEWDMIDALSLIYSNKQVRIKNDYVDKILDYGYLDTDTDNKSYTEDNDEIKNNMIVEFLYNINDKENKWLPKKIRWDKTSVYRQTNNISRTANDYTATIKPILDLVKDPITEKIISGDEVVNYNEAIENVYYTGLYMKNQDAENMTKFHNEYGKSELYNIFKKSNNTNLLELACGQGGDMHKIIPVFKHTLGMDISIMNIFSGKNPEGAYKRYYGKLQDRQYSSNKMAYLVMDNNIDFKELDKKNKLDTVKNLIPDNIKYNDNYKGDRLNSINTVNNYMIDLVYGKLSLHDVKSKYRSLETYYNILNRNKFDVISCQFAIHYSFKSMDTLTNFCNNIKNNLKPGGYFIGTMIDGESVNSLFNNTKEKTIIGKHNDKILWSIKKTYREFNTEEPENNIGLEIKNYFVKIGSEYSEYLVDYNLLKKQMEKHDLYELTKDEEKQLGIKDFKYNFKDMYEKQIKYKLIDELKTYSFLNRRFIFKMK